MTACALCKHLIFGADDQTNALLLQDAQTFITGNMARTPAQKHAHDLTANHYQGSWGKWCAAVGISRDTGDRMVSVAAQFGVTIQLERTGPFWTWPLKLLYRQRQHPGGGASKPFCWLTAAPGSRPFWKAYGPAPRQRPDADAGREGQEQNATKENAYFRICSRRQAQTHKGHGKAGTRQKAAADRRLGRHQRPDQLRTPS